MAESESATRRAAVYRVEGFTCANCALKFEQNVKKLPGVSDAKVNFGASKLTVIGNATIEELEQAGAFERLRVFPEKTPGDAENRSEALRRDGGGTESGAGVPLALRNHIVLIASALLLVTGYGLRAAAGGHHAAATALFAASILIGGFSLFKTGLRNLVRLEFDMRTLMTVAIIGAALIGEWEEGAVVVILFAISEALERYTMDRARRSIRDLMHIAPKEALVRKDGQEIRKRVEDIEIGDVIIVKPGEKIAMDGVVVSGRSAVNQSAITGESIPADKSPGDEVYAGTLNEEGLLEVRVTKQAEDTTIAKIIHLVEEAQGERAPTQAFVDRFAKLYTPIIMIAAALVAVVPSLIIGDWSGHLYLGLSVLVVGCPCALVISTPITIVSAIGNAARSGVLVKGGIYLEQLSVVKAVAFDKTGTLTKGTPTVTDYRIFDEANDQPGEQSGETFRRLAIMAALERHSPHPLAAAVVRRADEEGWPYRDVSVEEFASLTGRGVRGTVDGTVYFAGSTHLFAQLSIPLTGEQRLCAERYEREGKTVLLFGTHRGVLAIAAVSDELRETSREAVLRLHRLGVEYTVLLTGDHERTACAIAEQTGVREVRAGLMPQDKLAYIRRLQADHGKTAMVGDGVNDAPALAAADVGIAMGGAGADTPLETADVVLMGDDLGKLPFAVRLSRKAVSVIRQNIALSLAMKAAALLLVIPGWLTLWIAILSDMGATLLVALNGMRLMRLMDDK